MEAKKEHTLDRKIAALAHKLNLFDLEEILDVAIQQIPTIVGVQQVSIYLLGKDEKYLISKRHNSKKLRGHLVEKIAIDEENSIIAHAYRKESPLLITNMQEYIQKHKLPIKIKQRYTSGSTMFVPIHVRLSDNKEKILGILRFAERIDFSPLAKYDLQLASHVSEILGTAIHNCSVVEKKLGERQKDILNELSEIKEAFAQKEIKLDEAKKKQTQMLPALPEIPGYDFHAYYSSMETIGGDFYDFIQINEEEIGIILGDVSGHGIEAALVMSMAKQVLKIYSKLHRSLTETLTHANEEIYNTLRGESFIAVFLGILNTSTHVLRYARAGQTYPILHNIDRNEKTRELKSRGVVLGTVRGEMFRSKIEEKHIQFKPNDVLMLYTDGVVEANSPEGEEFGIERLFDSIEKASDQTTENINNYVRETLHKFSPAPQTDDITMLCLKAKDIVVTKRFDTKRVQKQIADSESFIISPELTYDEDVHYQMLALEQKIAELEQKLEKTQKQKQELEEKCEELDNALDMASNDPDGLIKSLREQLKIALELPRDLINENGRVHKKMEEQRQELRNLEAEFNQLLNHANLVENEYEHIRKEYINFSHSLRVDLLEKSLSFDDVIVKYLENEDYTAALSHMEKGLSEALEKMDIPKLLSLEKQLFSISTSFLNTYQKLESTVD